MVGLNGLAFQPHHPFARGGQRGLGGAGGAVGEARLLLGLGQRFGGVAMRGFGQFQRIQGGDGAGGGGFGCGGAGGMLGAGLRGAGGEVGDAPAGVAGPQAPIVALGGQGAPAMRAAGGGPEQGIALGAGFSLRACG